MHSAHAEPSAPDEHVLVVRDTARGERHASLVLQHRKFPEQLWVSATRAALPQARWACGHGRSTLHTPAPGGRPNPGRCLQEERAQLLYTLGLAAVKQGDVAIGRGLLQEAVETHPQHFDAAVRSLRALESGTG